MITDGLDIQGIDDSDNTDLTDQIHSHLLEDTDEDDVSCNLSDVDVATCDPIYIDDPIYPYDDNGISNF